MLAKNKNTEIAAGALLAGMVLIAYIPALSLNFFWDDVPHIIQNQLLTANDSLRRIWATLDFQQYLPIQLTTFWVEIRLWGLNPMPYHLTNVLLHAVNAILVWRVGKKLQLPGAWLAAAIFAVHPVHVETVAWVTERRNVLSGMFYLLAMLAWLRFDASAAGSPDSGIKEQPKKWNWYLLALFLYVLALLSKTVSASLPVIILVVSWMRGKNWSGLKRDLALMAPFFAVGLPLGLLTAFMERELIGARGPDWGFSVLERILICARSLWFYFFKDLFPYPTMFIYPRVVPNTSDPVQWAYLVAAVALIASLVPMTKRFGRKPAAGLLMFGISLFPALGFANVYPQRIISFVADHFQYLASLGVIFLAAGILETAAARARNVRLSAVCVPILAAFAALTFLHIPSFKNDETVWHDSLSKNPGAWLAHANLAVIHFNKNEIPEAIFHDEAAAKLNPNDIMVLQHLASSYARAGRRNEARALNERVLQLSPSFNRLQELKEYPPPVSSRIFFKLFDIAPDTLSTYDRLRLIATHGALFGIAWQEFDAGNTDKAFAQLDRAIKVWPAASKPYVIRAQMSNKLKNTKEAFADLDEAAKRDPFTGETLYFRAQWQLAAGNTFEAEKNFREVIRREPKHYQGLAGLGALLRVTGRFGESAEKLQTALKINAKDFEANYHLGHIYMLNRAPEKALPCFHAALAIEPDSAPTQLYLAITLSQSGMQNEAIETAKKADVSKLLALEDVKNLALFFRSAKLDAAALEVCRAGAKQFKSGDEASRVLVADIAWILATSSDDTVRNGKQALELISARGGDRDSLYYDTLAAAQAECGDFAAAVKSAEEALALLRKKNPDAPRQEFESRLKLYQNKKPFRS